MFPVALGHPVALQTGIVALRDIGGVEENSEEILIGIVRPLGRKPLSFSGGEIVKVGMVQIVDQSVLSAQIVDEEFLVREAFAEVVR